MFHFRKYFFVGFLSLMVVAAGLHQAIAAENIGAKLSAEDKKDLKRIEIYLNNMKTLRAGFLQVSSNGSLATGKLFLSRPGKMRFEYDPPAPILMIADGVFLIYIDKELEQVTHLWLDNTLVGFLVKDTLILCFGCLISFFCFLLFCFCFVLFCFVFCWVFVPSWKPRAVR